MNRKSVYIVWTVLLALLVGVGRAIAQDPKPGREAQPQTQQNEVSSITAVNSRISFQGVLKENGNPVTGSRDMVFRLYADDVCATQVGSDIVKSGVQVTEGLFSVGLDVTHDDFNGQELWLQVETGGDAMGCQEIMPAPYALSLRPGADIIGEQAGSSILTVQNSSSANDSRAIRGYASATTGFTAGVNGRTDSNSTGAKGVHGYAGAASGQTYGVHGETNSTSGRGVFGRANANSGTTYGGYFESVSSGAHALYGYASSTTGNTNGVRGRNAAPDGAGVYGYAGNSSGARVGVLGDVNGTGYGLSTPDDLYVGGSCTNCTIAFIACNAGRDTLKPGDVVAVSGVGPVLQGHTTPVIQVRRAASSDPRVLGVVASRGEFYAASDDQLGSGDIVQPVEGNAAPGDYLLVVTEGLAQVRVASTLTRLQPGQSLTVGDAVGVATLADTDRSDLIFAYAVEAQPDENGLLWAMIGSQ